MGFDNKTHGGAFRAGMAGNAGNTALEGAYMYKNIYYYPPPPPNRQVLPTYKAITGRVSLAAALLALGLVLVGCGAGKKDSSGGSADSSGGDSGSVAAVKGTGKNYTMSKDSDFKYDLTKIDGKDVVVIKGMNMPEDFKAPELVQDANGKWKNVLVDTITVKIPEKIEGYPVGEIEKIDYNTNDTESITSITIPKTVSKLGEFCFSGSAITKITLPSGITEIPEGAFNECAYLTSVTIPNGVTSIGAVAFAKCKALKEVTIPDSVTMIGMRAFDECSELAAVKLPSHAITYEKGIRWGGSGAFSNCPKLSLATRKAIQDTGYKGEF